MTRKGKIARLPQVLCEQINRRLQNGKEGKEDSMHQVEHGVNTP